MNKLIEQIVKFGLVGFLCFGIDFVIYTVLWSVFDVNYLVAAFFGFIISLMVNYLLSMKFVFVRKENLDKKKEFIAYFILSSFGLLLNQVIIWISVDVIYENVTFVKELVSVNFAKQAGKIVATAVVMVYNFITRKIFLEQKDSEETKNVES